MRVVLFFDGQNFYRSLTRYDETLRVDYDKLATWITNKVGGPNAVFGGAYYYVGVSTDAPPVVEGFLKGLELRPGYFVRREPRVKRHGRCPACNQDYDYYTEKRVDTRLVAEMLHSAASNAFDSVVLISGDDDFVPLVEAVSALGKQVWVATWSPEELSKDLRTRCFGYLSLSDGISQFRSDRVPGRLVTKQGPSPDLAKALAEVVRAEARLPHVSRGYFILRWKSHNLPPVGQEREVVVQRLIEAGMIEEFDIHEPSGKTVRAIRHLPSVKGSE